MAHIAALIRELMRQSQDAQENAHQNYCWAEKKRENWDFVVAYCDKKLTLARNYIDKITKCEEKKTCDKKLVSGSLMYHGPKNNNYY